jgi:hypothetical protein
MKKYPILLLIIFLGALLLFQSKVVVPLVKEIAASDFFLTDTETKANSQSIDTQMTEYAFIHCNDYIQNELDSDYTTTFSSTPINAWDIGGYQYVINAEIEISSDTSAPIIKKYVCRIKYDNGSDMEGIMNSDNWSVYGLSGLDDY